MRYINVLVFLASAVSPLEGCNPDGYKSCLRDFQAKYPHSTDAFLYHGHSLNNMCSDLKVVSSCVKQTLRSCPQSYQVVWEVFHNGADYMCSEKSKQILHERHQCTQTSSFLTEMQGCNSTLQSEITRNQFVHGTGKLHKLCTFMEDFSSCATGAVQEHCDASLSNWYAAFLDVIFKPSKDLIHCYFHAATVPTDAPGNSTTTRKYRPPYEVFSKHHIGNATVPTDAPGNITTTRKYRPPYEVFSEHHIGNGCNPDGYKSCLRDFQAKYPHSTDAFSYHGHSLDNMCSDLKVVSSCVKETLRSCPQSYQAMWEVFHNGADYVCSDKSKKILHERHQCTQTSSFLTEIQGCNSTFRSEIRRNRYVHGSAKLQNLCTFMEDFSRCATGAVQERCDASLSNWYAAFLDVVFKPSENLIHCYFHAATVPTGAPGSMTTARKYRPPYEVLTVHHYGNGGGVTRFDYWLLTLVLVVLLYLNQ